MSDAPGGARPLVGRTALVTGASRGIGRAIAEALVAAGARVALVARGAAPLRGAAAELSASYGDGAAAAFPTDLADASAVAALAVQVIDSWGDAPDVVVNNAGVFAVGSAEEVTVEAMTATLQANLVAPFALVRALLPRMRARGTGHLVTIGSIADRQVFPGNAAYAASKHGVRALHEVLRLELRGTGVRATLVSPGPTDTPLWDPLDPDHREGFTPRAAMLSAAAVADAVRYAVCCPAPVNVDELRLSRS